MYAGNQIPNNCKIILAFVSYEFNYWKSVIWIEIAISAIAEKLLTEGLGEYDGEILEIAYLKNGRPRF